MKALIYHLKTQLEVAETVKTLLRKHLVDSVAVSFCDVEGVDASELGDQYFRLLQAAVDPQVGLRFSSKRYEGTSYRLYAEVYHQYFYSGYTGDSRACFPAVAVEERMVLVPRGVISRYGRPVFLPYGASGLLEVEFSDDEELDRTVRIVADQFRVEAKRKLLAYKTSLKRNGLAELGSLAENADIDPDYLRHVLSSEAIEPALCANLFCDVQPRLLQRGHWTEVMLSMENNCDEDLIDASVIINGPVQVRPISPTATVSSQSTVTIPIALLPEKVGEFPIELKLVLPENHLLKEFLPVQYIWLSSDDNVGKQRDD